MHNVLTLKNIYKRYRSTEDFVLHDISLTVRESEFVALVGPSGSGKSTLLHIAGLLDNATHGAISICDNDLDMASDHVKTSIRLRKIGFVYQYHNLLPDFNAVENVMLPQLIAGMPYHTAEERAKWLLSRMKLDKRFKHRPSELSGGEQQRVAIARALANSPKLLLADEPTGNLDPKTSEIVFGELLSVVKETGLAALIATHNFELAAQMDRKVCLSEGKLSEQNSARSVRMSRNSRVKNFY